MPVDVRSKAALRREHAGTEAGDRYEEGRQPLKNQIRACFENRVPRSSRRREAQISLETGHDSID